ncbi:pheromone shutdown-related protein TraB [Bacillus mesophilus]|uniref:TraB/GumN family protein n=1 Tax=Bacillus mesophilus TaxID=1808955 RepID=A0A6M0Q5J6_9BACI|nr:TraB/GumN family protein [Bacillus mesophilus]MBM7659891.1 pheromone shutdown-related protein TraB [Bacillus mesophilus]NEY70750.1 TraB/GumN family protein [Bacillus mesophilus]
MDHITRLTVNDKEIILVGTAHVSKQSAEEVKRVIESERPDTVCIELDQQRYQSLTDDNKWKEMDIFEVIKKKKASLLLMNLVISSFQKRLAKQFGIKPGQEMMQGIESAKEIDAKLVLADRNIQITFSRIWNGLGLWGKSKLMMVIIGSIFNKEDISEEELEKIKSEDMLDSMLQEFSQTFPDLKKTLIDERDQYLAQKIKEAPGDKVVAVVGAAHVPGIKEEIKKDHDLKELNKVPVKKNKSKIIGWLIPALILGLIGYTLLENPSAGLQQTISWILWNGSFAALGAAIAFAHPLAVITAFFIAPISSLNPLMAAGWFSGIVHVYFKRPNVNDFIQLSEDVYTVKGFWRNKVSRVLLIVILTNLGSTLGTIIGGADIVRVFFENI